MIASYISRRYLPLQPLSFSWEQNLTGSGQQDAVETIKTHSLVPNYIENMLIRTGNTCMYRCMHPIGIKENITEE